MPDNEPQDVQDKRNDTTQCRDFINVHRVTTRFGWPLPTPFYKFTTKTKFNHATPTLPFVQPQILTLSQPQADHLPVLSQMFTVCAQNDLVTCGHYLRLNSEDSITT